MTDTLIEAVARAEFDRWRDRNELQEHVLPWPDLEQDERDAWIDFARAAIAAIEASGTHRVVPAVPTEAMKNALAVHLFHIEPEPTYAAMLAAAPKVVE